MTTLKRYNSSSSVTENLAYSYDGTKAGVVSDGSGRAYLGSMVFDLSVGSAASGAPDSGNVTLTFESAAGVCGRIVKSGSRTVPNYEINDYLGSVRVVTGPTGSVLARHDYYATGARMYDPSIARWTVQDPLAEKYLSWSPYVYCVGDPVNYFDPDGLEIRPKMIVAGIAMVVGGGAEVVGGVTLAGGTCGSAAPLGAYLTLNGTATIGGGFLMIAAGLSDSDLVQERALNIPKNYPEIIGRLADESLGHKEATFQKAGSYVDLGLNFLFPGVEGKMLELDNLALTGMSLGSMYLQKTESVDHISTEEKDAIMMFFNIEDLANGWNY